MTTQTWYHYKPITMTFRAKPAKKHHQWPLENKRSGQPFKFEKPILEEGEAWSKMVELYDAYAADKSDASLEPLHRHIVWYESIIWNEIPRELNFRDKPIDFWIIFRDAAEWDVVKRILRNLPADYVHQYLLKQAGTHSYFEDLKVILEHFTSFYGMEDETLKRQYSPRKETLTPEQALFMLNAMEETNITPADSLRAHSEKLRKRHKKIENMTTKTYWDGSLPENVNYADFSDQTWVALLSDMPASTVEKLLHVLPENVVTRHFKFHLDHDSLRAERDFLFICEREENKDVPQEWLRAMYLS